LTQNGQVFSMGTGSRGELGIEPMEAQSSSPKPIEDLIVAEIKVDDIACGGWHGLALTCKF
jgi:alpha-tubulin suppressor-like RCC1 family protein